ncbi:hypothetical protein FSARC_14348 [Fusarium sarcochroum]|uniref:Xylanolytic transcriptional activator regulatory domain-containing protein n=1 Tax=Fusarium sarcochroum TaxID=1208366 RepID=A0A8H4SUJ7_9HYPO|nr:hypothetical protein FSARC_14348 [Fusarium sarcochroum]
MDYSQEALDDDLWESLASGSNIRNSTVSSWSDIILPNSECSRRLIDFDITWNSWVHYALEYPRFKEESDAFTDSIEAGLSLDQANTTWVAVYFSVLSTALLMMEDDEAQSLPLSNVSQNWYDAAIFCLYKSDFMRYPHINNVQAIAILIMSFNNRGDSELGHHLRSSAIRIAQRIGLNETYSEKAGHCLGAEGQHRLWWTLVICEWLSLTRLSPIIDDSDFNVPLPSTPQPETQEGLVDPVHYHIFMARTSAVVYRFRIAIKSGLESLDSIAKVVKAADEELAGIIDTLPSHLQPESDSATNAEIHALELTQPWIKWQRYDLTLVLLHLRMHINGALQRQWLSSPNEYHWARSVSVASAMSIIWINRNWDQPASTRKQWALSYHIFNSAILLLHECRVSLENQNEAYNESIQAAIDLLDAVESRNALAHHAAKVLREKLKSVQ